MSEDLITLEHRINQNIVRLNSASARAEAVRVMIGQDLILAQALVPRGEWEAWCRVHINLGRNQRDVQKCMKLAAAADPAAAHEAEKEILRAQQEKIRTASKHAPYMAPNAEAEQYTPRLTLVPKEETLDEAEQVVAAWLKLSNSDRARAFARISNLMEATDVA